MEVKSKDLKKLELVLGDISKNSLRFAQSKTMNSIAFAAQQVSKQAIKNEFINRNTWTQRTIVVEKGNKSNITARMGSTQDYMETQESGGFEKSSRKFGVVVPQPLASGETSSPRKKTVRPRNKLNKIKIAKGGKSNGWGNVYAQARAGAKVVFLENDNRRNKRTDSSGFFTVKRGKKFKGRQSFKFEKLYDLSNKQIKINSKPWLEPSVDRVTPWLPSTYEEILKKEIETQKLRRGLR